MLKAPKYLDKEAKAYHQRHQKQCVDNGTLTEETHDTYCLLCRVWSLMAGCVPDRDSKEAIRFVGLSKMYVQMAKPFGLFGDKVPAKKKASLKDVIANALQGTQGEAGTD